VGTRGSDDLSQTERADSGFALTEIDTWCSAAHITSTIGLATDARLERAAADLAAEAGRQSAAEDGARIRLLGETRYQADSWPHERGPSPPTTLMHTFLAASSGTGRSLTPCRRPSR
jgi:hypothetical protein